MLANGGGSGWDGSILSTLERAAVSLSCSFVSALAGWLAGVVGGAVGYSFLELRNVLSFAAVIGIYSTPVIGLVWLFMLWPLYALVPRASVLWRPWVCVGCGVAAGSLLAGGGLLLFGRSYGVFLFPAPLIGGVTCAVGRWLRMAERPIR